MSTEAFNRHPSDEFLLQRVAAGDPYAYELIYRRHSRPALAAARRLSGRSWIAEEAIQEAFLAVWLRAHMYTASRGKARAWILSIVHNRLIDATRRRARVDRAESTLDGFEEQFASSTATDVEVERRQRARAVHRAVQRLPPTQREAVVLTHFRGLSNHDTATAVGRPVGTIKGRIRLGHDRLRHDLSGLAGAT